MTDGDASFLVTDTLSDTHYSDRLTPRMILGLGALYCIVLFCCWEELRFGTAVTIVPGTVVDVRQGPKQSQLLRYQYSDPITGETRRNSVNIGRRDPPRVPVIDIQVLPGPIPASRPAFLARPALVGAAAISHGVMLLCGLWVLARWIREANSRPLTRQQRAISRLRQLRAAAVANSLDGPHPTEPTRVAVGPATIDRRGSVLPV